MCDPLTIAGVALTGASVAANQMAASKAAKARNAALDAETARQTRLRGEAEQINAQSQDRYVGFDKKQDDRGAELADYFTAQEATPGGDANSAASFMPVSSSNVTVAAEGKEKADARAFTDKQGEALGELRSFGDHLGAIGRQQARDAGRVGQIGNFIQGSSSILPYELEAANQKGAGLKLFGDIAGGLGSIGTNAGLSGVGASPDAVEADPWENLREVGKNKIPIKQPKVSLGSLFTGKRG